MISAKIREAVARYFTNDHYLLDKYMSAYGLERDEVAQQWVSYKRPGQHGEALEIDYELYRNSMRGRPEGYDFVERDNNHTNLKFWKSPMINVDLCARDLQMTVGAGRCNITGSTVECLVISTDDGTVSISAELLKVIVDYISADNIA